MPLPEPPSALCNLPIAMAVTVKIPTQLRSVTGGDSETAVDGATTVGDVLDGLYDRYDGLRDRIAGGSASSASASVQRSLSPSVSKREPIRSERARATTGSPRSRSFSTSAQPIRPCAPVTSVVSCRRPRPGGS